MNKQENLRKHVQYLCDILNNNNFTNESFAWNAGSDPKSTFGGGICFNKEAFHFLKKNGHLDRNVCWKCGEEPISNNYSFTDGIDSSVSYKICSSCYGKGRNVQNLREGKGSKKCYIATVCYGNIDAPEVEKLRVFRDKHLASSKIGLRFINSYYNFSPAIANWMKNKKMLNKTIKTLFLNPLTKFLKS